MRKSVRRRPEVRKCETKSERDSARGCFITGRGLRGHEWKVVRWHEGGKGGGAGGHEEKVVR